tara:strand:+ start:1948 stop:2274 length:327 start_codon:yes stop_codon:yes gene_type:complete
MDQQVKQKIEDEISNNEVCLFMKGTPEMPECGFSMAVVNILKLLEVKYKGVNVLADQSIREGIKSYSEWPTIPQLYVNKEFIGGCDIVKEMFESGELKSLFKTKNLIK